VAGSDVGESDVGGSCSEPNLPCAGVPTTGICDPVCQLRGCDWCTEKCSYVFDGTNTRPACVSHKGQAAFPDSCVLSSSDLSQQSDDCAPGNICLPPTVGDSIQYCFQLCSIDADCLGGVACGQRKLSSLGDLIGVCDPPYDPCGIDGTCCDPLGLSGCSAPRGVCLLVSPDQGGSQHSRTVCEFDHGGQKPTETCSSSRDCLPKTTCVNNICRQVCNTANPCPSGDCTQWGTEYGYCSN